MTNHTGGNHTRGGSRLGRQRWCAAAGAAFLATLATVAGSLSPIASSAFASTTPKPAPTDALPNWGHRSLAEIKALAAAAISLRVNALNASIKTVQGDSTFLGSDATTLVNDMTADISGLGTLGAKIKADTTVAQAIADADLIFTEFRVYYVMLPVVRDVTAIDYVVNAQLPALDKDITTLQGEESASNQAFIAPLVSGMQSEVQIATGATNGLVAELVSYTPAEWDSNHQLFTTAKTALNTADRAITLANRYLAKADKYLSSHPTTTTTTVPTTTTSTTTTSTTTTTVPATTTTTVPATTTTTAPPPPPSSKELRQLKALAAQYILSRERELTGAIKGVQDRPWLGSYGATLVSNMEADVNGLEALGNKIQADTTVAEVRDDTTHIYTDYRVFYLNQPVVADVIRVGRMDDITMPHLAKQADLLQTRENRSNRGVIAPLVANMRANDRTVLRVTNGLVPELVAFTPAEWNANHKLLNAPTADMLIASRAVNTSQRDLAEALHYLDHPHSHPQR